MKYRNRFVVFLFSILMLVGVFAFAGTNDVSAQTRTVRRVIYRPVFVRRPFFYRSFYDPFYDPYFYDPFLRAQRDKYYADQRVARERRDMAEHRAKFYADGILTPKEQEQMRSDQEQLAKALHDLREARGHARDDPAGVLRHDVARDAFEHLPVGRHRGPRRLDHRPLDARVHRQIGEGELLDAFAALVQHARAKQQAGGAVSASQVVEVVAPGPLQPSPAGVKRVRPTPRVETEIVSAVPLLIMEQAQPAVQHAVAAPAAQTAATAPLAAMVLLRGLLALLAALCTSAWRIATHPHVT